MPRTTPCEPSTQRIQSPLADESECGIGDDDNGRRSPSHTEGIWGNLFNRRLVERLKLVIESVNQRKQFAVNCWGWLAWDEILRAVPEEELRLRLPQGLNSKNTESLNTPSPSILE
ncbi:hypothetical protein LC593_26520 [Nostoc sp. CHAB 5844]|nr:hypothetical protein [Nostoc sp. CHAB 5844]